MTKLALAIGIDSVKRWQMLRYLAFICVLLSYTVDFLVCHAQGRQDDIGRLLKERRNMLSDAFTQMNKDYIVRQSVSLQALVQSERDYLKADLDLQVKSQDRIKTIMYHKEIADNILKLVQQKAAAGRDTDYAVLQAKAYVLEVQIELIKEKERQQTKPEK